MNELRISLPEAQDVLRPRVLLLNKSFADAFSTWLEDYAPHHMVLSTTARARIINDHFYFNAAQNLSRDKGTVFRENQLQRFIVFDERLVLRFKLFDNNLQARNYPTERAKGWVQQLPLKDMPPCERLHFGYRLDLTGTVVRDAFITLPTGTLAVPNDWVWQIWGNPIDLSTFGIQMRLIPVSRAATNVVYAYDDFSVRSA
jgi:hypothetical protein